MKRVTTTCGRFVRLCLTTAGLLFAQQSFAVGTPAGDSVSNTATVSYSVGTVPQTDIDSNTVTFLVDQRVDFTLVEADAAPTSVVPDQDDAVTAFTLTNTGNAPQDFALSALNLTGGTVHGLTDNDDIDDPFTVFADTNGSGVYDAGDITFVDGLSDVAGSNSILVFIVANIPADAVDGAVANVEMTATAHDSPSSGADGSLGALTTDDSGSADDPNAVQVVFATAGGAATAQDGYSVASANLTVTKASSVIDDGFSAPGEAKPIPGATVEFTVTVTNAGAEDAVSVGIADELDGNVTIALGEYGAGDAEIDQGGALFASCTLDATDGDTDGCGMFTGAGGNPEVRMTPAGLTLGGTVSGTDNDAVFRFRVTID